MVEPSVKYTPSLETEGTYFSPFSSAGVEVVALNIPDFCQFWLNFIGTTLRHLGGT